MYIFKFQADCLEVQWQELLLVVSLQWQQNSYVVTSNKRRCDKVGIY